MLQITLSVFHFFTIKFSSECIFLETSANKHFLLLQYVQTKIEWNLLPNHMASSFHQYQARWALDADNQLVPCLVFSISCAPVSRRHFPDIKLQQTTIMLKEQTSNIMRAELFHMYKDENH